MFDLQPIPKLSKGSEDLIPISSMEPWLQKAFEPCTHLNTIQSKVYKAALYENENIMICAPTGAGKTNIALLTILHEIAKRIDKGKMKL